MLHNYYIKVDGSPVVNLSDIGVTVKEVSGLSELPESKEYFYQDWKDEQGVDVYLTNKVIFKEKEIKITFIISGDNIQSSIVSFFDLLFSASELLYFDTYRNTGFRGIYAKHEIGTEKYRQYGDYIEFDLTFLAPNGIYHGFSCDNEAKVLVTVKSESTNLYWSDGSVDLDISESFVKSNTGIFVISEPTVFNNVEISFLPPILFATRNDNLFVTRVDNLITT